MEVSSLGRKQYFCMLVDDKTGFLWYYPCALKSDFTAWFIKMDAYFDTQFNTRIKTLRTDRGGEYVNATLEGHCEKRGIGMELTVPHTP
jgi:hypothetical protein